MKKIIALLVSISMLLNFGAIIGTFAADEPAPEGAEALGEIASCTYDSNQKKISISGTVKHEVLIEYDDYSIGVYMIPVGKTLDMVLSDPSSRPLASSTISIKFQFSIKADTNEARFAKYAVVIYKGEENVHLIDSPCYPTVVSDYDFVIGDKSAYKAAQTELLSCATDSGLSSAIFPVYLDRLVNDSSSGYLYSLKDSYIYFDKEYIGELDADIRSLSAVGSKVYLQFLIEDVTDGELTILGGDENAHHFIPDMTVSRNRVLIEAFSDFLCDRYNTATSSVSGIILGERIDEYYSTTGLDLGDYAYNFGLYMAVVGNAARAHNSKTDIVVPFGDRDSYSQAALGGAVSAHLLEELCVFALDEFANGFKFSTLISTSSIPYGISDETLKNGGFSTDGYDGINADRAEVFSDHLASLSERYETAPKSFIFLWNVPQGISGEVLSCAYAYSYYKLLLNDRISSFAVSFAYLERAGEYTYYPELFELIKNIDTESSGEITAPLLDKLSAESWSALVGGDSESKPDTKKIIKPQKLDSIPNTVIGDYPYYDFSYHTDISAWFGGNRCESLKTTHNDICGRSLSAYFSGERSSPTEYSEFLCAYDYPESFVYTPYMSLRFSISNDENIKEALYEVKLSIGDEDSVAEIITLCRAYEDVILSFDISDYAELSTAKYLKISLRSLTGEECGYTFSLASLNGYSTQYTSDQLADIIADERLKIRDMLDKEEDAPKDKANTVLVVCGVLLVVTVIGVGIFMCFRRDDTVN